jgi:cytochrome c biogenesis protein CcmG, thiol:disulfide interchange protein DsbE
VKSRTILLVSVAVLVVLAGFSAFLATRHQAPGAASVDNPIVGKMAPNFTASTLSGSRITLSRDRGHIVVLTFWASWCEPCQQESPDLSTFAWQQRTAGVDVIGVVWDDTVADALAFQRDFGVLFPSVTDPYGSIANSYGVTGPPTTFVIDARGQVVKSLIGATTTAQLDTVVAEVRA